MTARTHSTTRTLSLRTAAAVAALGLALAACGDDSSATPENTSGAPVLAIDGHTYLSDSVTGYTLAPDSRLTITFDGGRLSASAGCNSMGGDYGVTDGALVIAGGLAMSEMACDEALMTQEQWFSEFLASSPTFSQDGDRLTLSSDAVTIDFLDREVADPDRPLETTTWNATTLITGETASSVPEGASLMFQKGTVAVATGCNTGSATYEVSEDGLTVTLGPIGLTKMACDKGDVMAFESAMVSALEGPLTVEITAGSLTLTGANGGLGFTAAD